MQVSGLILAAGLAVKVICHSDVTGTWRQQATLGGLIWPRWQTRYAFADWFRVVDGMNCVAGPWLSLGGSGGCAGPGRSRLAMTRSPGCGAVLPAAAPVGGFKFSTDPLLDAKVRDVVGLYLHPPDNAVVVCVDEKSQCLALERTQPVLPRRSGIPERQAHDYARHGVTCLIAALEVATGTVTDA
jgi:hypothetical protein